MLVSYKWLQNYVNIPVTPQVLAEKLTAAGVIVDNVYSLEDGLEHCVVGKITEIVDHPDADKLVVCTVDIKDEILKIVTGAPNVQVGQYVPVAKIGAKLPGGLEIKKTTLRGVESNGMLLSASEIGFDAKVLSTDQKEGIMVLPEDEVQVGQSVIETLDLDDHLLELDLTPNRSDCSSLVGLAYDIAAIFEETVKQPKLYCDVQKHNAVKDLTSVDVQAKDLCAQYSLRLLQDVKIKPSPLWLQNRLRNTGIRPVNNIVDLTNYVMTEQGQPLHAFDYNKLDEGRIIVRRAVAEEQMVTLDDVKRSLTEDMLVIADASKPVGIAGVMGGLDSEITKETTKVALESASFHYASIRRTSRSLGLPTDAANRFGKGIDQGKVLQALARIAFLAKELGVANIVPGVITQVASQQSECKIKLEPARVNELLGTSISKAVMLDILERLAFAVEVSDALIHVTVPTRRPDVTKEVDLIEEIARLWGYDNIEATLPKGIQQGILPKPQQLRRTSKEVLLAGGVSEVVTYAFHDPTQLEELLLPENHIFRQYLSLDNPITERQSMMRTTLLPGLLQVAKYNLNRQQEGILLGEISTVFVKQNTKALPKEKEILGLVAGGVNTDKRWYNDAYNYYDFFDIKGIIEVLLKKHGIKAQFEKANHSYLHPGRSANVVVEGHELGYLGELHPDVLDLLGLDTKLIVAELCHDLIVELSIGQSLYNNITPYPAVVRDMAIVVDNNISMGDLISKINEVGGPLLEKVQLFDIYDGAQIPTGKKSCAFTLTYRASDRTLTDDIVSDLHETIINALVNVYSATLR